TSAREYVTGVATTNVNESIYIYVTGITHGGLDSNSHSGGRDIFLTQYNDEGTKQWTRQLGGTGDDNPLDVTADSDGNAYIVGYTTGSNLDGQTKSGSTDAFFVKYNSSGTKQWTELLGVSSPSGRQVTARGVTTDSSNNVYVVGSTNADLGGETKKAEDGFLIKYNSSFEVQWTKLLGCEGGCTVNSKDVAIDSSNNIYVVGTTSDFRDNQLNGQSNSSAGSNQSWDDMFIAKYNSSGVIQWTRLFGTTLKNEYVGGVAVDNSNIYVVGNTTGDITGDSNQGLNDTFIVKYNDSGTKQWEHLLGTSNQDHATGVVADPNGFALYTGYTQGGLDGNSMSGSNQQPDVIIVNYDLNGELQ
ncbi:uncharacterized protein METZ01_LOCUS306288, partial [marine metagenome]